MTTTDETTESSPVPAPPPVTPPPAPSPTPPPPSGTWRRVLAVVAAIALFVAGMAMGRIDFSVESDATDTPATTTDVTTSASGTLADASAVAAVVVPSVVTIEIQGTFRNQEVVVGSGSGVIWDAEGHIVTNAHVIDAGDAFEVVLSDGRVYPAEVVGVDESTDLAVLSVEADDLTPITLGSTDDLTVGSSAVAVGSPLGLEGGPSVSAGVVSAFDRIVTVDNSTTLYGMLQADAPITQGSSGGALVDDTGRLIGITSAVGVSSVGVEGIGFSTPVEIVDRVVTEILADGDAAAPLIGITGSTAFGTTTDGAGEQPIGVEVVEVVSGSAADDAGLEVGDVVTTLDGTAVDTMDELVAQLRRHAAGDAITVEIERNGATQTIQLTLGHA